MTIEAAAIRAEEMLDAGCPGEIPRRIRAMKDTPFTRPVQDRPVDYQAAVDGGAHDEEGS